jgi:hypothetical protein
MPLGEAVVGAMVPSLDDIVDGCSTGREIG